MRSGLAIIHFPFAVVSPILVAERDIDYSITFVRRDGVPLGNSIIRPLPFSPFLATCFIPLYTLP